MPDKPIHLPVREVALAAKAAFDGKRLSAQGPTPACRYRDESGLPCAVGAALTDEQAGRIAAASFGGCSVNILAGEGLITSDDIEALRELQSAHDTWAVNADEPSKRSFLRVLGEMLSVGHS